MYLDVDPLAPAVPGQVPPRAHSDRAHTKRERSDDDGLGDGGCRYGAINFLLDEGEDEERFGHYQPSPPRWYTTLYTDKDWWSVWEGMACLILIILLSTIYKYRGPAPGPRLWNRNAIDAWEGNRLGIFAGMCTVVMMLNTLTYYIVEVSKPAAKRTKYPRTHGRYPAQMKDTNVFVCDFCTSLVFISMLGVWALWLSEQREIHRYGLTFEVWGLVLGMIFANIYGRDCTGPMPDWMGAAAKGEDFIKVGLVLLGLDIRTIGELAGPGLITSWLVTPIVIVVAYRFIGQKLLKFDEDAEKGTFTKSFGMMMACGLAVCGSSAATAIHGAIPRESAPQKDAELKLTIALLNVFTIVQMIAWPYVAWAVNMQLAVAAAWFGGSIDGTGNVVAAGAILDELLSDRDGVDGDADAGVPLENDYAAVEIASTVKMLQNAIIGPVAIGVTVYWMAYVEAPSMQSVEGTGATASVPAPGPARTAQGNLLEVWKRFPKFVLGFLISSVVLTMVKQHAAPDVANTVEALLISTRSWWFTIGFVGVGMTTNVKDMMQRLKGGQAMTLYVLGQSFDLLLTYAAAYLSFAVLYAGQFDKSSNAQ